MIRLTLIAVTGLMLSATAALAGPVTLKANPVDTDGRVTLGDVFDGAGSAAGVVIGNRAGPSVVFEAGQLQSLARQSGLEWANPNGLRRVVVRAASVAPATTAATSEETVPVGTATNAPLPARPVATAASQRVVARNDVVEVAYEVGGIRLTISGRAEANAAAGQRLPVRNLQSGKIIEAVATGPGQAIAGPAAQSLRTQQFAAR